MAANLNLMSVQNFAREADLHEETVTKMLREGRLPGLKLGGRWRVKVDEVLGMRVDRRPVRPERSPEEALAEARAKLRRISKAHLRSSR